MWRRLLRLTHPDAGGDEELFVWTRHLQELVVGDHPEPPRAHRDPPEHRQAGERVDFTAAPERFPTHEDLTSHAVWLAQTLEEPFGGLLRLLTDCYEVSSRDRLYPQQHQGATYRSLCRIGHEVGMSGAERGRWYQIAREVPLSQRHASHILSRL